MTSFEIVDSQTKIDQNIVPFVTFPLINVCTQKCVYCGDGAEMTLCNEHQIATEDLLEWHAAARELGVTKFRITGGETLLHKDFHRIIHTVAADATEVLVNTNGTVMTRFPEKWRDSPSNCHYVVNYHGATEETYDKVSGTTGYFDVAREGIRQLVDAGLLHRLNAVINRYNQHEIWDIIAYAKELGTNLKIQDVVSVPWAFNEWLDVHVDTIELERQFEERATYVRDHQYARAFGTPTKIYTIDGVNMTLKSIRNGSQYDLGGICENCPHYPCHEGVYDVFVFADNTAWACNWTTLGRAKSASKRDQLAEMIAIFQRADYRPAPPATSMQMSEALPERSKLQIVEIR